MNSSVSTSRPDRQAVRYELLSSPEQLQPLVDFLAEVFPGNNHLSRAYLDWLYFHNPAGSAIACNALVGDELVSHFAIQPFRCRLHGESVTAGLALNVGTRQGMRQQGLLVTTGNEAIGAARSAGLRVLTAVTNAQSTRGFVSSLGFQYACQLEARIGMGRVPLAEPERLAGARIDFQVEKTTDHLSWRLRRPGVDYYTNDDSAERVRVYAPTYSFPLAPVIEMAQLNQECLARPLPQRTRKSPFILWLGLSPARSWTRTAFALLPERLKPSPLNFVYQDLQNSEMRLGGNAIELDGLDFDAY